MRERRTEYTFRPLGAQRPLQGPLPPLLVRSVPPSNEEKQERASLRRDLGELLIEISIGVHRYAMYPPDHPALVPVAENIITRLALYFEHEDRLDIGVAREHLVIGGIATDAMHPVLSDLARRLHDHQIGALGFRKGVRAWEVELLLEALSADTENEDAVLGTHPEEERPPWEKISIHPVGYEKLQMREDVGAAPRTDRAVELWLGLARAAVESDEIVEAGNVPDESGLAKSIERRREDRGYDQVIAGYLLQLADELKGSATGEARRVRSRMSSLIEELDEEALNRLVDMGGDAARRRKLVLDANQTLAVEAVMKMVEAAASTSEQTISTSMVRLLNKLSRHARQGPEEGRSQADTALRDNVERLVEEWSLEDPNPEEYTLVLDALSRSDALRGKEDAAGVGAEEAEDDGALRMVEMALEVEAWGPIVQSAVSDLVAAGRVGEVFDLMAGIPDSVTIGRIRRYLTAPAQVRRLLSGDDVDEASLATVVEQMGPEAVGPLMDALVESESRAVRRKVFDRLSGMEEHLRAEIGRRLEDARWYVVRNMLALIQRLDDPPEDVDFSEFLDHPDHRVRREAFPLAVRDPSTRTRTLALGLADEDERLIRMALLELRGELPETLVPTLVSRVIRDGEPESLRALAVRVLRGSRSPLARRVVLELVRGGKTLFGRSKLAEKSPVLLAALEVLSSDWGDDPEAVSLLEAGRRSGDPEIVRAATEERDEA